MGKNKILSYRQMGRVPRGSKVDAAEVVADILLIYAVLEEQSNFYIVLRILMIKQASLEIRVMNITARTWITT